MYAINIFLTKYMNALISWRGEHLIYRDISDQELISCLHDQPRSGTFTSGDLLFVYTQYDDNTFIGLIFIFFI